MNWGLGYQGRDSRCWVTKVQKTSTTKGNGAETLGFQGHDATPYSHKTTLEHCGPAIQCHTLW